MKHFVDQWRLIGHSAGRSLRIVIQHGGHDIVDVWRSLRFTLPQYCHETIDLLHNNDEPLVFLLHQFFWFCRFSFESGRFVRLRFYKFSERCFAADRQDLINISAQPSVILLHTAKAKTLRALGVLEGIPGAGHWRKAEAIKILRKHYEMDT